MTRKDYINIAAAIRATQARINADFEQRLRKRFEQNGWEQLDNDKQEQLRGVRRAAAHLADFLADDNPRFDQGRFLTECGYGGTGKHLTAVGRAAQSALDIAASREAWAKREETERAPRPIPDVLRDERDGPDLGDVPRNRMA
jgi:hypothetical protein